MAKELFIMCGAPGSGKSTYVKEHAARGTSAHISRDNIRFAMVSEKEEYFSKEKEVYTEFVKQASDALHAPWIDEVWVDATNMTKKSRLKLLRDITFPDESVYVYVVRIMPNLETCLAQNDRRRGRACVPETAIRRIYESYEDPWDDGYEYEEVYEL